jgi:Lectin C-type domain
MSLTATAQRVLGKGDRMWRILCTSGILLLVLIGCGNNPSSPKHCPSGAVRWTNGHCYEAVLSPGFSWYDAKAACEARGGHLVTITSAEENAFVFSLVSGINAFWYLDGFGNGLGPWLGGYQDTLVEEPDSAWHWVTGEPWVYTNWEEGQPGDTPWFGQDCLRFFKAGGLIGDRWDDSERYNPVEHRKGYICEYE